jgi:hypothetical protein
LPAFGVLQDVLGLEAPGEQDLKSVAMAAISRSRRFLRLFCYLAIVFSASCLIESLGQKKSYDPENLQAFKPRLLMGESSADCKIKLSIQLGVILS